MQAKNGFGAKKGEKSSQKSVGKKIEFDFNSFFYYLEMALVKDPQVGKIFLEKKGGFSAPYFTSSKRDIIQNFWRDV